MNSTSRIALTPNAHGDKKEMSRPFLNRRNWLKQSTCGVGLLALAHLQQSAAASGIRSSSHAPTSGNSPLLPKSPHFEPRAKQMIFLHMRGGPSHMESFERKPELDRQAGEAGRARNRKLVGSHWDWKQRGESGLWVSDLFPHQAEHADDLCVLSGMHTDIANHTPAMLLLHTGSFAFTRPSMGAWLLYGLGTECQNLPGFVSLSPPLINGGSNNYGTAFLPAVYQGTRIGDIKTPIANASLPNLNNDRLGRAAQLDQLEFLQSLNQAYGERDQDDTRVDGIIESHELAFRMQTSLPDVMDLSGESQSTLDLYGIGEGKRSDNFGRQCLIARRMIEAGVRHVELCDEFWDQHSAIRNGHAARAAATDQPIGALLADLKQRGLLNETLVLWGGEFGRTPDTARNDLGGRDHNANGYTMWMAGGGVKGGYQHGSTDDLGYEAVTGRVHLHDLHATILHLMGLDHTRLSYQYGGREFRLTDVHGRVIDDIIS